MYGEHDYEVLTSSREGLQRQEDHFGSKQRHDTDGYNIIPFGYCTYRNRSDDGKFAFNINTISEKAIVSKFYPVFRFTNANSTFMAEFLNSSPRVKKKLSVLAVGTSQVVLSFEALKAAKFDLPCKDEQDRIAAFLECLNTRIENQRTLVVALKKYKRGLLSREFGQQENGDLNNRYVGKLKDYFHLSSGSTPSSTNRAFYSGNIRWVSSGELKPKYLCETSQHISSEAVSSCNLREYPANTLLVAMYGLEAAGVRGTASILSVPATISQACMAIQQTGEIDIEYLYYWYIYNGQWIGIRIAQGTKQQNLSTDTLGNLRIHAPSCSKQKKVCKLLSQIDYLIEKEGQKIDLLSSAKSGLLQQLFI